MRRGPPAPHLLPQAPHGAQQACRCQCEGPARHWLGPSSAAERLPLSPAPPPRAPAWAAGPPGRGACTCQPHGRSPVSLALPPGFPAHRVLSTPLVPPLPSEQLHLNSFLNVSSARSSTLRTPQLFWTGPRGSTADSGALEVCPPSQGRAGHAVNRTAHGHVTPGGQPLTLPWSTPDHSGLPHFPSHLPVPSDPGIT